MALQDKKNKTIFTKTGDGNDKVEPAKITELETKFENAEHIQDSGSFAQLGIVYLQLQNVSEELDELRRHLTEDFTGGGGSQGPQGPQGDKGDKGDTGNTGAKGADGAAGGVYEDKIKILPTAFMGNDDASLERTIIEDDIRGKLAVRVASSSQEIFAAVAIPKGKSVKGYRVYTNSKLTTYLNGIDLTTGVMSELASGFSNETINLKNSYSSTSTNYVAIKVMTTTTSQLIYGATITIS
jgi:hypothetical protein